MNTAYKKISSHGSINIPVAMRRELGIEPKDPMVLQTSGGGILITPYVLRCSFCGETEKVIKYLGKGICTDCAARLAAEVLEKSEGGQ